VIARRVLVLRFYNQRVYSIAEEACTATICGIPSMARIPNIARVARPTVVAKATKGSAIVKLTEDQLVQRIIHLEPDPVNTAAIWCVGALVPVIDQSLDGEEAINTRR